MKLLIGAAPSKIFHLKEFAKSLMKFNIECKIVNDVEYADWLSGFSILTNLFINTFNIILTITNVENVIDNTILIFQFEEVTFAITPGNDVFTLSNILTPMDLLLFVEGVVEVGGGTDKYLDLSTNDDDPEKPPLGIQIAVTNVPTTIGHAEQCNKLLHTILACLNNGYIFNKLHSVG